MNLKRKVLIMKKQLNLNPTINVYVVIGYDRGDRTESIESIYSTMEEAEAEEKRLLKECEDNELYYDYGVRIETHTVNGLEK